jgi:glycosyltransferase involved in cell wall biosynthesis
LAKKEKNSILWCGRFLGLKQSIHALEAALNLKKQGYLFKLKFIGNGPEEERLKKFADENDLLNCVEFCDFMPPETIRAEMEKAEIYLFTSDKNEGWGAVLNESMNSACAVITSHAAGAAPYLVKDGENGLVYESGNVEMLTQKLKMLLDSSALVKKLGMNAYRTITETWNAEFAANRFIALVHELMSENKKPDIFSDGPCSIAKVISDDWDSFG